MTEYLYVMHPLMSFKRSESTLSRREKMKRFRLTVIMLVVGAFVLVPVVGNAQNAVDWYNKGIDEYDEKNYEKAIEYYAKAISIDPNYTMAYNNRGSAYFFLKRYNEAIADYTKVISIDPNDAYAYNNRGFVYYEMKEYDNALEDITVSLRIDPNDSLYPRQPEQRLPGSGELFRGDG